MRLWPYQMLSVLPRPHLLSQWRECLAVGGMLGAGTLNHATVNRIKNYPMEHFHAYCDLVREEFARRGYTIGENTLEKLKNDVNYGNLEYQINDGDHPLSLDKFITIGGKDEKLLGGWHEEHYIRQCYYMFQEKFDVGMLYEDDWGVICNALNRYLHI